MPRPTGWPEAIQLEYLTRNTRELIARAWPGELDEGTAGQCRQIQLQHRPGAGISVLYAIRLRGRERFVGLSTEKLDASAEVRRLSVHRDDGAAGSPLVVSSWLHPNDPRLPGLRHAGSPDAAQRIWGEGQRLSGLETVTYRPLRRAVFRAEFTTPGPITATRRCYLKVMRPGQAEALHLRHGLLAAAGLPVPAAQGPVRFSTVALDEAAGEPLARLIADDGGLSLDPRALLGLLDAFPPAVRGLPGRPAWADRLPRYAAAAAAAAPELGERIDALARRIGAAMRRADRGPVVAVHGDFYEANLLVDGGRVSGLLDLDAAGSGYRVDDLACFLGHLAMLPAVSPRYRSIPASLEHFGAAFARTVDEDALWSRAAAVAVSLVAGARRPGAGTWLQAAQARVAIAEALADRCG